MADFLARTAAEVWVSCTGTLKFGELSSVKNIELNELVRPPFSHPCYFGRSPEGSFSEVRRSSRSDVISISPAHSLAYLGFTKDEVLQDSLLCLVLL
ncbi:hypothetical protein TNCV_5132911 [Trichonephila clavipes]|nr:hypothetical protein TNCV_5132911 [Trichonephila clavipes]